MKRWTRRALLVGASALAGASAVRFARPLASDAGPALPVLPDSGEEGGIVLNDASELSPVRVARHVTDAGDPGEAMVTRMRTLLAEARTSGQAVAPSAARHSMGGQSLPTRGLAITLDQEWLETDTTARTYRVAAGTRWSTVIARLDKIGFSPAVMQSNNDFGVASTYSVNAHGWPVPFSGCGATVRSLRMVLADGTLVTCSRKENADIFRHAMGGYGLFGIVTELELDMVENSLLEPTFERLAATDLGGRFAGLLAADDGVRMAYGRLDVSLDRFFEEGLLIAYRPAADQSALPAARGSGFISHVARAIFRAQTGSDLAKHLRWWTEVDIGPSVAGAATRNTLMNEPVVTLDDRDPSRTDILHEYFVAPERFAAFVKICREIIPASYQQLLNVTLRYVAADRDSILAYAPQPRIAAVMLFSQEKTVRAEADMARMTRALIDGVLSIGGSYYLPYRPHATLAQLAEAYPAAGAFAAFKRDVDKALVFRNQLWDGYFARF